MVICRGCLEIGLESDTQVRLLAISFLHHFPSSFGRCSVYGTPAVARVSCFVPYTELPPFEG